MKIAILAGPLDNQQAGVHTYTHGLVRALAATNPGHEIVLIREKKDDQFSEIPQIIIPNIHLPIGWASLRMFTLVPWRIRNIKADIVIEPAHFGPFNLPKRIKRVTVIHDLTPILFPQWHRWHSQMLQKIFLKRILRKADMILANSKHTANDIAAYCPAEKQKVRWLYLGKDSEFIPTTDQKAREELNLPDKYFLFTGTLEPRKNLRRLLKAYSQYVDNSPDPAHLVIAGGRGWKSTAFQQELADHPHRALIHVCGYVSQHLLPGLYSNAQIFIYPSLYEGFGLPVLEAMSCGTPVITSNNSSLPEVGGDAPLYIDPENIEALGEAMRQVDTDEVLRENMAKRGLMQAAKFSWEDYGTQLWTWLADLRVS